MEKTMDKIVQVAKARGFVYPGSEIYGGLANTWDYGNLGVELKNNVKRAWWKKFIQENPTSKVLSDTAKRHRNLRPHCNPAHSTGRPIWHRVPRRCGTGSRHPACTG